MFGISLVAVSVAAAAATLSPGLGGWGGGTVQMPAPPPESIGVALARWNSLRQSDNLPFEDYARFLIAHPGWPGEGGFRRNAERKADPAVSSPDLLLAFFSRFSPLTTSGKARYAETLAVTGHNAEALAAARLAWAAGMMPPDDEARLLSRFGSSFTPADNDMRMERLLWDRSANAAFRLLSSTSPSRQPFYAARLSMQTQGLGAEALVAQYGNSSDRDPGFLADHLRWLRDNGRAQEAIALAARPVTLDARPLDADKWLELLLSFARLAQSGGSSTTVYQIALNAESALPAGTSLRDQNFGIRDAYTSLVWLGADTALRRLGDARGAMPLFDRYARASQSAQSQAKGYYWAGRAAVQAGDTAASQSYFARAAAHGDQFYGQLAAERLGQPTGYVSEPPIPSITPADRVAFEASDLVQAARFLGQQGRWQDQTQFIRAISLVAKTDADHALAGELARSIGRPDLGVMIARNLRNSGASDPIRIGFPEVPVPPLQQSQWTMIHAISRQESQFDRQIVSRAGAMGLMQLMPATARQTAEKMGLAWQPDRLSDMSYNMMLGSAYFQNLLDGYSGNYVLAIAAYNAGQGNVRKFIAANGDPRMPGMDVISWIEAIPFSETRGYVQRVLENAVVYDRLNPSGAKMPERNRLSAYLGKQMPG